MPPTTEETVRRAELISQIALDRGWDAPTWDNFLAKLMLVVTEVQEAEDAIYTKDAFLMELADVVIRTLDVLHTLDKGVRVRLAVPIDDSRLLGGTRRRLCRAAEFYRKGADDEALGDLWDVITEIDKWATETDHDLWSVVDKKIEINRSRPKLHGKKRSIG